MSRESYFRKFPVVAYGNAAVRDVTRRAVIPDRVRRDLASYYPYTLREGERVDHVSDAYYEDPQLDWLVWMGTGVVDPYHDWHLTQEALRKHIRAKWGSVERAQETILWWQVEWSGVEEELTPAGFASLPEPLRKYYQAQYGQGTRVVSYRRTREDWTTTTNMVVRFEVGNSSSNVSSLTLGENIRLRNGNTDHANAVVAWSNSSEVKVIHVFGNVAAENCRLVGVTSGANLEVTQRYYEANCIPVDERPFWAPHYAYEMEVGINERNKTIKIIDAKYKVEISDAVTRKINE